MSLPNLNSDTAYHPVHLSPEGPLTSKSDPGFDALTVPSADTKNPVTLPEEKSLSFARKLRLSQNLLVISIGFMLIYSAFNGMQNVASSLLREGQLGLIMLSCVYGMAIFSSLLSPFAMKKLTPKWSLVGAYFCLILFLSSLFYPRLYTVIPSSMLWGALNGPLWTAASMYVTTAAIEYGTAVRGNLPDYMSNFNAIWMMLMQMSQIIGNIISAMVLKPESQKDFYDQQCGLDYDQMLPNVTNNTNSTQGNSPHEAFYMLGSIYLAIVILATILTIIFLRPFRHQEFDVNYYGSVVSVGTHVISEELTVWELLVSAVRLWKDPKMYLTIPLQYMAGSHIVFLVADFTKAYVDCGIGVNFIGFTMLAFGVANALGCFVVGKLHQYVGRVAVFTSAFVFNIGLYVTLFVWRPVPESYAVYFIIAAVWGIVDAVMQPQTMAFLGFLFPVNQEAAFANYNLMRHIGMTVTYAYSGHLSIPVKLYIAVAVTVLTAVSYTAVECRITSRRMERRRSSAAAALAEAATLQLQTQEKA